MKVLTSTLAVAAVLTANVIADDSIYQQASDAYSSALDAASSNLDKAKSLISEQISGTPKPIHEEMLSSADSAYSGAIAAASSRLNAAAASFSSATDSVFPTQGSMESISSIASANYQAALARASSQYASAKAAVGATPTPAAQRVLDDARRSYYEAVGYAYAQYDEYTGQASSAIYGPPAGSVKSATSVAAENWASLVSAASEKIYGTPTPVYEAYASQITDAANAQYVAVAAYLSELVSGKEPDFTESVYSRFSSVYYTNDYVSSASSVASEAYASASSVASEAASVVSSYFAPREATVALDRFTEQLNSAINEASKSFYGTQPGYYEQATSIAADAASSASEAVSSVVYGTQTGYAEAASVSVNAALLAAQVAVSEAIYGTTPGVVESASSIVGDSASSISSYVADSASQASEAAVSVAEAVQARVSAAIYGPEVTQGAIESLNSRMSLAVASAQSRIAEFGTELSGSASVAASVISESVESAASSVSSAVESIRDEL